MELPREEIVAGPLTLRPTDERDVDDIERAANDPLMARFLPRLPSPYTRADAEWWVREGAPARWAAGAAQFTILEDGGLVGTVGFPRHDLDNDLVEVGYWVAAWARGRGIATAATRAATAWAFDHGAGRVELMTERENRRSQRVALAAGFTYEGVRRGAARARDGSRHDLVAWARVPADPDGPAPRKLPDPPGGALDDGVVRLRPRQPDDATALAETVADPESQRWASRPGGATVDEQRAAIEWADSEWLTGQRMQMTICDAASGAPAGDLSAFWVDQPMGVLNLGYSVHPAWRRRGFATRAARLATDWLLGLPSVARVEAGANVENTASQAVLRRAGFVHEGTLRELITHVDGPRQDIVLFSRLPSDA
jgi:RimJ/RimL family protein N-acetyltransferase